MLTSLCRNDFVAVPRYNIKLVISSWDYCAIVTSHRLQTSNDAALRKSFQGMAFVKLK